MICIFSKTFFNSIDFYGKSLYSCQEPWIIWTSCEKWIAKWQMFGVIRVNDTYSECVCEGSLCNNNNNGIKCYSNPRREMSETFRRENLKDVIIPDNLITCQPNVKQCILHGNLRITLAEAICSIIF